MTPGETWSSEMALVSAALGRGRVPKWPDDCPECGTRMEFVLVEGQEPVRTCICGRVVTVTEVFNQ